MKHITLFLAFCAVALTGSTLAAQNNLTVVTVNFQRLYSNYDRTPAFEDRLNSIREQAQQELATEEQAIQQKRLELQALAQEFQATEAEFQDNPLLSDEAKQEQLNIKRAEIEAVQVEGTEMLQAMNEKRAQYENRIAVANQTHVAEIREMVNAVAADEGADLVLDTSNVGGSGLPLVLYSDPRFDITSKVLEQLNEPVEGE